MYIVATGEALSRTSAPREWTNFPLPHYPSGAPRDGKTFLYSECKCWQCVKVLVFANVVNQPQLSPLKTSSPLLCAVPVAGSLIFLYMCLCVISNAPKQVSRTQTTQVTNGDGFRFSSSKKKKSCCLQTGLFSHFFPMWIVFPS